MNLKKLCEGFSRAVGVLSKVFLLCSIIAVAMIAVVSSVDSIGRYILGSALRGASEYVETGMAVCIWRFSHGYSRAQMRNSSCVPGNDETSSAPHFCWNRKRVLCHCGNIGVQSSLGFGK